MAKKGGWKLDDIAIKLLHMDSGRHSLTISLSWSGTEVLRAEQSISSGLFPMKLGLGWNASS